MNLVVPHAHGQLDRAPVVAAAHRQVLALPRHLARRGVLHRLEAPDVLLGLHRLADVDLDLGVLGVEALDFFLG